MKYKTISSKKKSLKKINNELNMYDALLFIKKEKPHDRCEVL